MEGKKQRLHHQQITSSNERLFATRHGRKKKAPMPNLKLTSQNKTLFWFIFHTFSKELLMSGTVIDVIDGMPGNYLSKMRLPKFVPKGFPTTGDDAILIAAEAMSPDPEVNGHVFQSKFGVDLHKGKLRWIVEKILGRRLSQKEDKAFDVATIENSFAVIGIKVNEKGFEVIDTAYSIEHLRSNPALRDSVKLNCFGSYEACRNELRTLCPWAESCAKTDKVVAEEQATPEPATSTAISEIDKMGTATKKAPVPAVTAASTSVEAKPKISSNRPLPL
jgi:hypothetical protein